MERKSSNVRRLRLEMGLLERKGSLISDGYKQVFESHFPDGVLVLLRHPTSRKSIHLRIRLSTYELIQQTNGKVVHKESY